jgi:hypothetical protein
MVRRSAGAFPEVAFDATLARQPGEISCSPAGTGKPFRLDLVILDEFLTFKQCQYGTTNFVGSDARVGPKAARALEDLARHPKSTQGSF